MRKLAGRYVQGGANLFLGYYAGYGSSANAQSPGTSNIGLGYQSSVSFISASYNVAIGVNTLYNNQHGEYNVAIGQGAGDHATGSYNTFVGGKAGEGGTTSAPFSSGQNNVAVGYQAFDAFT